MHFTYDANGTPLTVIFDWVYYMDERTYDETTGTFLDDAEIEYTESDTYYYITNIQGDVIELLKSNGESAGYYRYDAWGNDIDLDGNAEIIYYNPLRYRGYIYDRVSGYYYLQTRFYDADVGRFINADAYVSTGQGVLGNNMFAYCLNNPVIFIDPCGTCVHNWKLYDCERCAAFWNGVSTAVENAWNDVSEFCVDAYDKINSIERQQQMLDDQIRREQIDMVNDAAGAMWDAYVHSNELEAERQYRQDMEIKAFVEGEIERWTEKPSIAGDFAFMSIGYSTTYISYVAFAANPTVGAGVLLGFAVAGSVWSTLRYYEIID